MIRIKGVLDESSNHDNKKSLSTFVLVLRCLLDLIPSHPYGRRIGLKTVQVLM